MSKSGRSNQEQTRQSPGDCGPRQRSATLGLRPPTKVLDIATACPGLLGLGLKVTIERVVLGKLLGHPHGEVEQLFRNLPLMALALLTVGLLIIVAGLKDEEPGTSPLNGRIAAMIGVVLELSNSMGVLSGPYADLSGALQCCNVGDDRNGLREVADSAGEADREG